MREPIVKKPKPRALDQEGAETIGLQALGFLASDDNRIAKFLSLTGIDPSDLIAQAKSPNMLLAVLEHLGQDESLLLVFASENGLAPEAIGEAIQRLEAAV
jgi:Protein of unknown function (DUF3572)